MYTFLPTLPAVSRDPTDIEKFYGKSPLGIDLEFSGDRPTILGLSDGAFHLSVPYADGKPYLRELLTLHPNTVIVGHNFSGADFPLLVNDGLPFRLEQIEDSVLYWWLCNPHLSKSSNKTALEEDGGERRGRGFNNLSTMASVLTNFPHWKDCRGAACEGPCPAPREGPKRCPNWKAENEYLYNAYDAAAPVLALPALKRTMQLRRLDHLYPLHRELAYVLSQMREFGVRVDMPYVAKLTAEFSEEKELIAKQLKFNPDSPKQVIDYFRERGIVLPNSQEETVRAEAEDSDDPELILLLDYKELGNGSDRWFKEQYIDPKTGYLKGFMDPQGYVHPHLAFFTSSSRLMSSSPNLQNVAKRRVSRWQCECECRLDEHTLEWSETIRGKETKQFACSRCSCRRKRPMPLGKRIRRAIIAPPGYIIIRRDYSNAENRVFLHLAEYEPPKGDLHEWMIDNIGLREDDEFSVSLGSARDASKSVTHGCIPGDHEVLTPWGWLPISHWTKGIPIAQWSPEEISFVIPSAQQKYDIDEPLQVLHGRAINQRTTLNHRFPSLTSGTWNSHLYNTWHKTTFLEMPKSARMPITGVLCNSEEVFADDDIRRTVAIQADASYKNNHYSFHVVKERKKSRLKELFGKEGIPCKCHPSGMHLNGTFHSPLLNEHKQFTCALLALSQRQRLLFLEEILLWDGSHVGYAKTYFNTDAVSLIWVQTISHLSGKQALLRKSSSAGGYRGSRKQGYRLSFNARQFVSRELIEYRQADFKGSVYCFTVPTGHFLVRYRDTISVTGNSDYGEGLQLKELAALKTPRMKKEIDCGARIVFWDWKFKNKIVTFTGVNLANRAFKSATFENRAKANAITARYLDQTFPKIRELQKKIFRQVEVEGVVRPPHGYTMLSYGDDEDRLKTALAHWGSQPVAHFTKIALLRSWKRWEQKREIRTALQVHDELLGYAREDLDPVDALAQLGEDMAVETPEIPGLIIPTEGSYGPNWRDQTKVKEKV